MTDRIICGVDPGNAYIGLVRIRPDGLDLGVIRGATQPRPTKRNPKPGRLNPYQEAHAVARKAVEWCVYGARGPRGGPAVVRLDDRRYEDSAFGLAPRRFTSGPTMLIGIEAGAMSRNGRQDALAAARQAFFDVLAFCYPVGAPQIMRPVTPQQAKKALTGYAGSDKRRMCECADAMLEDRWKDAVGPWHDLSDKEQEAVADALGIALYLEGLPG